MRLNNTKNAHQRYIIPDSNQILELSPSVLHRFKTYRQNIRRFEAGGLLFAEFCLPTITIKEATRPHRKDKRSRYGFIPCRNIQRKLISQRFDLGFHFIGEWHTHPEDDPSPSSLDLNSMHDSFIKSKHELNFFVMIIAGSNKPGLCLWIGLHNNNGYTRLKRIEEMSEGRSC